MSEQLVDDTREEKVEALESEARMDAYMRGIAPEKREAARLRLSELGRWALLEGDQPE